MNMAMLRGRIHTFSVNSRFLARSSNHLARILCKHTPQVNMGSLTILTHTMKPSTQSDVFKKKKVFKMCFG